MSVSCYEPFKVILFVPFVLVNSSTSRKILLIFTLISQWSFWIAVVLCVFVGMSHGVVPGGTDLVC